MTKVLDSTQSYTFGKNFDLRISAYDLDTPTRVLVQALSEDLQRPTGAPAPT
jgi:hypothetical protein